MNGGYAALLYRNLEALREAYPPQAFHALMNLLSTHDQARSLHVLGWTDGADDAAIALAKRRGSLDSPLWTDAHAIVLARRLGDQWAITATNNADVPHAVTVEPPLGAPRRWADALAPAAHPIEMDEKRRLTLNLPALGGTVLLSSPE